MNEAELKNSVNIQSSTLGRLLLSAGMKPGSGRALDIFTQAWKKRERKLEVHIIAELLTEGLLSEEEL